MIIIQRDFKVLNSKKQYRHEFYFQSWYSSIFLKNRSPDDNDESCCITFQVISTYDDRKYLVLASILLPEVMDSHEVMTHLSNLRKNFNNNTLKEIPSTHEQRCVIVPANENDYNFFASKSESKNIPIQRLYIENNGGDLNGLMHRAISISKKGNFFLVLNKNENCFRTMDERFLELIIRYPSNDAYAISYAWAQGLVYAERFMGIFEKESRRSNKIKHAFYGE